MERTLTTGQVAAQLGVRPKLITDLFYAGRLRENVCPVQSGRRLIPENYVEEVARALRTAGKLPLHANHEKGALNNA